MVILIKEVFFMPRLQTEKTFVMALLVLASCLGCNSVPEPAFLTDTPNNHKGHTEAELTKYKALSNESAKLGWKYLAKYFNKNSFVPAVNRSYIGEAMDCFNYCWSFNNKNYQAYWGAGVVRGIQATLVEDKALIEKYLEQSIKFLLLAKKYDIPPAQVNKLNLDLANAYNGLGAFSLQVSKKEQADTNLEFARTLLLDVIKKEPENGRAFYLLAVTYFYQGKYDEANQEVDQATSKHFNVPEDFLKDLTKMKLEKSAKTTRAEKR
jgi:tetratricopeptide (TPR) repeat protein